MGAIPTSLSVIECETGTRLICRLGDRGRAIAWRLRGMDLLVANVSTVLEMQLPESASIAETARALAARGRLSLVNPFEAHGI